MASLWKRRLKNPAATKSPLTPMPPPLLAYWKVTLWTPTTPWTSRVSPPCAGVCRSKLNSTGTIVTVSLTNWKMP